MKCSECGKTLTNADAYGHDCEVTIKPKEFVDTRTGKTVTQFSILDIGYMKPKVKE